MLDKTKIENALLDHGISTNKSKELAGYLADKDLLIDKNLPIDKKKKRETFREVNEVIKE